MKSNIKTTVLNVAETCQYMKISRTTLSKYMKRGEIHYVKLAGAVRFFERDILNFLDSHRVTAN